MKEKIVEFNRQFGLKTVFFNDSDDIFGYAFGDTIYLNENKEDLERINKHELLHFFENDEAFISFKKDFLNLFGEYIDRLRSDYLLYYSELYTKDEIDNGVIDTEIVIDYLVNTSTFEYENGLRIGEIILEKISKNIENKRYLNLSINNNVAQMKLSKWTKLFVTNYYNGRDRILPPKSSRKEKIDADIKEELNRLLSLTEEDFKIDRYSDEVKKYFMDEVKYMEENGKNTQMQRIMPVMYLTKDAEAFSKMIFNEYKHIVEFIKEADYEDAFKVLMLREAILKTYKLDTKNGRKTIINKRDLHKSISSLIVLNKSVLDYIYQNVDRFDNFADLYFEALEKFSEEVVEKNRIEIENVDTFGKGHWVKFEGKTSVGEEYLDNSYELAALVKNTQWCTKRVASKQLSEGDFYIFVDNTNKPHIAVKLVDNKISEVRGILADKSQEIEEEYRDVALSFLKNNEMIKNREEWQEREEKNRQYIKYIEELKNNQLDEEELDAILSFYAKNNDSSDHRINIYKTELAKELKSYFIKNYNYDEEDIYIGNISFMTDKDKKMTDIPYKVVIGNINFAYSEISTLKNIEILVGNANFSASKVENIGNLSLIAGNADFHYSRIHYLKKLEKILGSTDLTYAYIADYGKIRKFGESVFFSYANTEKEFREKFDEDGSRRDGDFSSFGSK